MPTAQELTGFYSIELGLDSIGARNDIISRAIVIGYIGSVKNEKLLPEGRPREIRQPVADWRLTSIRSNRFSP